MQAQETLGSTPSLPAPSTRALQENSPVIERIRKQLRERAAACVPKVVIPARFEERARFEALGWIAKTPAGKKALDYCRKFAEDPARVKAPLLMGASGTGKTHLLLAVARRIRDVVADQAEQVRAKTEAEWIARRGEDREDGTDWPKVKLELTTGAEIAHQLRSAVGNGSVEEVACRFLQQHRWRVPDDVDTALRVLFIDDIEVMKMTDWLHGEVYRIVDKRYADLLPTPMASNLTLEELRQHLGDRIARRIRDMVEPLELS